MFVQHYQLDADGLCCRLKNNVEKMGAHDIVVSLEDFKKSNFLLFLLPCVFICTSYTRGMGYSKKRYYY